MHYTTLDTQSELSVKVSKVKQTFRYVPKCARMSREHSGDMSFRIVLGTF
jgi:uncharacterized Fe-S cluster-containing protein